MSSPNDTPLSPSQRSKIRRLSICPEPTPGEEAGELNIIPYLDIITNILVFVLATISVIFLSNIDTTPPSQNSGKVKSVETKAMNLVVLITSQGIAFTTSGGHIATGCKDAGVGMTVPMITDGGKPGYDWQSVTSCARHLKSEGPTEWQDETQVTITASPGIEFQHIVSTVDSIRNDEKGELFPEIHFGVAR